MRAMDTYILLEKSGFWSSEAWTTLLIELWSEKKSFFSEVYSSLKWHKLKVHQSGRFWYWLNSPLAGTVRLRPVRVPSVRLRPVRVGTVRQYFQPEEKISAAPRLHLHHKRIAADIQTKTTSKHTFVSTSELFFCLSRNVMILWSTYSGDIFRCIGVKVVNKNAFLCVSRVVVLLIHISTELLRWQPSITKVAIGCEERIKMTSSQSKVA